MCNKVRLIDWLVLVAEKETGPRLNRNFKREFSAPPCGVHLLFQRYRSVSVVVITIDMTSVVICQLDDDDDDTRRRRSVGRSLCGGPSVVCGSFVGWLVGRSAGADWCRILILSNQPYSIHKKNCRFHHRVELNPRVEPPFSMSVSLYRTFWTTVRIWLRPIKRSEKIGD